MSGSSVPSGAEIWPSPGNRGKNVLIHKHNSGKQTRASQKPIRTPGGLEGTHCCNGLVNRARANCEEAEDIQLVSGSVGIIGDSNLLVGLQFSTSSCSCPIMSVILGRTDGESEDSNSSSHICINSVHNTSENPTVGRSGRVPLRTFCMTAASGLVCSNGLRPVTT